MDELLRLRAEWHSACDYHAGASDLLTHLLALDVLTNDAQAAARAFVQQQSDDSAAAHRAFTARKQAA